MSPRNRLRMSAVALVALVVAGPGLPTETAPRERAVVMTIVNQLAPTNVLHDGKATYTDFKLTALDEDICVNGLANPDGSVFFRLNRRQNWPDGRLDLWCHERPEGAELKYPDRTFTLRIDSAAACGELGYVDVPCLVQADKINQPHVQAATVFKSKAKSSTVSWQFDKNGRHFQVNTVGAVPMSGVVAKTLTWTGYATLGEIGGAAQIGAPFLLPFQVIFEPF